MAWVVLKERVEAGIVTDPRDLMVNLNELGREVNGFIDRDNIQEGAVTDAKWSANALNNTVYATLGGTYAAPALSLAAQNIWPWTNTGLGVTMTTDTGVLVVDVHVGFQWPAAPSWLCEDRAHFRIVLDGTMLAESGAIHFTERRGMIHLGGAAPVMVGSHTVGLQVRAYSTMWVYLDGANRGGIGLDQVIRVNNQSYISNQFDVVKAYGLIREERR